AGLGVDQPNSQIRTLVGGDPNLKPEFGTTFTYGFVYSPSWVEGLDVTIDYWEVELNDLQTSISAGTIMNRCLGTGGQVQDTFFCQNVERNASGTVQTVRTARTNLNGYRTAGIDLGAVYRWDAGDWGNFRFALDTSWVDYQQSRGGAGSPWGTDNVGFYGGSPSFEYRSVATIDWSKGDYSVRWTTRYMSDLADAFCIPGSMFGNFKIQCEDDGYNHTGAYAVHDLNLGWNAPWDARISVGARNLFGKEPPILYNSFAHSFDASYDLPGGAYWYMSYRQDF
ncbi:MAG: TonB-dependent receptor domain-containing protein, partial [Arenimonas sp.]